MSYRLGSIIIVIILAIPLLISCTNSTQIQTDFPQNFLFENPKTKQKFNIIYSHNLFQNYINKAENVSKEGHLQLYKSEVIGPIYDSCFNNAEHLHMVNTLLNKAPDNFSEIVKSFNAINIENTNELIREALIKSSELLPTMKQTNVCVFPTTKKNSSLMVTAGSGKIIVLYNEKFTPTHIKVGIAHEYHHSVWTEKYLRLQNSHTVLSNLIYEGKAVMFEKIVYPDSTLTPIDLMNNKSHWSKIEPYLNTVNLNKSLEILYGGQGLPSLYGYSEGYKMVNSYLKLHPDLQPNDWIGLDAKEIYENGQYIDN